MKPGSSPGVDSIPAEVFTHMAPSFLQPMTDAVGQLLRHGTIPTTWALYIMSPIPKEQGFISINALRPLCLQNVIFKWASATILLMMDDIVAFATPLQQKAFINGRFIFDHICNVRGALGVVDQRILISMDFSKAYESVSHNYLVAFFMYIALPPPMVSLLMAMFKSPFIFQVGLGVVPNRSWCGARCANASQIRNKTGGPALPSHLRDGMFSFGAPHIEYIMRHLCSILHR